MTFWPWISIAGAYIAIMLCYEFLGIEGFCYLSYRLGIMVNSKSLGKDIKGHWHHLVPRPQIEPEPHNSVMWAWTGVPGNGEDDKVIQSFLWLIFVILTAACEICIRSHWAKKLVSCFGQWDDVMAKGELGRGIHSYNAMLWILWNQHFVYLSHRRDVGTIWSRVLKLN